MLLPKKKYFFSVLAVALAVGIIIMFMGIISGFSGEMINSTVESAPHITVNPIDDDEYIHLYNHFGSIIDATEGVLYTSPVISEPAALTYRGNAEGIVIEGIDPRSEINTMRIHENVIDGDFESLERSYRGVVLGNILADNLDVTIGERVTLVRADGTSTSLEVVAIVSTGTPADETLAYAQLDFVQDHFDKKGQISYIKVRVADIHQAENIASTIKMNTDLDAISWMEQNEDILDLLNTQQAIAWLFYLLIFIVAGFGIANTLYTIVMDRKKRLVC